MDWFLFLLKVIDAYSGLYCNKLNIRDLDNFSFWVTPINPLSVEECVNENFVYMHFK